MTREDLDLEREQKCETIGDVVAAVIPPPAPGTQALPPESVALAMTRQPPRRLRAAWRWAPAMAVAAVALVVAFPKLLPSLKRDRPLNYELTGSFAARDDGFETPAAAGATARFSDGTSIAVGARSVARVKARTRAGATIQLDRGRASFAVVHRPGADWHVEVGPYEIAVTGTEFDVRWSENRERFEVLMKSGSIVVRGALTGGGIPLRAGQRLVASLTQKTLVVEDIAPEQQQVEPSPAPPTEAPREEPAREEAREEPSRVRRERAVTPPPAAPRPPRGPSLSTLQPPPFEPAPPPPSPPPLPDVVPPATATFVGQGGVACGSKPSPQIRFEHVNEGFRVLGSGPASVFSNPVIDHTHSWCGGGALRFDASFDNSPPRAPGEATARSGEAVVYLPRPVDMRGRTVTLRLLVQGAYGTEFAARILVGQGDLRTGNSVNPHLTTDQWWTISATFHERPPGFGMPPSQISNVDRLILKIDVTGDYKVWSGFVYVDDISWR